MLPPKTKTDKQPGALCEAQKTRGGSSEAGRCPRRFLYLPVLGTVECRGLDPGLRSRGRCWARAVVCPHVHAGMCRGCCMCVCARVGRICFYTHTPIHTYPAPQPQRTGRSVSGLPQGLQTTRKEAEEVGVIACHQHVCMGWYACRSHPHSFVLSEASPGLWGRRSFISTWGAHPSYLLSRQQQTLEHLLWPNMVLSTWGPQGSAKPPALRPCLCWIQSNRAETRAASSEQKHQVVHTAPS